MWGTQEHVSFAIIILRESMQDTREPSKLSFRLAARQYCACLTAYRSPIEARCNQIRHSTHACTRRRSGPPEPPNIRLMCSSLPMQRVLTLRFYSLLKWSS